MVLFPALISLFKVSAYFCGISMESDLMHTFNSSHEYQFSWTIDNFLETPDVFRGPPFCPISRSPDEKFCFEFRFEINCYSYLLVYLRKLSGRINDFNVRSYLSFRITDEEMLFDLDERYVKVEKECFLGQICFKNVIQKHNLLGADISGTQKYFILLENKLILKGKLIFCSGFMNSVNYSPLVQRTSEDRDYLYKDFKSMYRSGLESDVTIHIGDKTIFANRGILCCRSPVFRKMFEHSMKEKRSNTVNITDIEFHVFDCFVMYLYTGELEDKTWNTVLSLYSVADKYEVKSLHSSCSRILASGLSVESACSVLLISVLHNDEELKKAAIHYMSWHFSEVAKSSEWADIVATKAQLASEVLSFVTELKLK